MFVVLSSTGSEFHSVGLQTTMGPTLWNFKISLGFERSTLQIPDFYDAMDARQISLLALFGPLLCVAFDSTNPLGWVRRVVGTIWNVGACNPSSLPVRNANSG